MLCFITGRCLPTHGLNGELFINTIHSMSWHGPRNRFRDNHENWNEQERGYAGNGRGYNDRYRNNNEEDFGEGPQRWRNEGRRGYRGGRGRNRGQRGRGGGRPEEHSEGDIAERGRRGGRRGMLAGLRGREIGMFFAARSRAKKERQEIEMRPKVSMETSEMEKIQRVLDSVKDSPERRESFGDGRQRPRTAPQGASSSSFVDEGSCSIDRPSTSMEASNFSEQSTGMETSPEKKKVKTEPRAETSSSALSGAEEEDIRESLMPDMEEIKEFSEDLEQILPTNSEFELFQEAETQPHLNESLKEELKEKMNNSLYKSMLSSRHRLPAYKQRKEIIDLINSNQIIVLSGETGCGKTTQVPQFILDHYIENGLGSSCNVICTQPRRISAISVAERVAVERGESQLEQSSVGYSIRLENRLPRKHGSILFCTTGIILRRLESDPKLQSVSHIIIDEVHERDLLCDFLMVVVKDLVALRPDLRVILMSATLNAEKFSKYFNDCPHINIPGYTFPVKQYFLEDAVQLTRFKPGPTKPEPRWKRNKKFKSREEDEKWNMQAWARNLSTKKYSPSTISALTQMDTKTINLDLVLELLHHIIFNMEDGAILVFVPGWKEISDLNNMLLKDSSIQSRNLRIVPLHSLMPTVNQREVFDRPPAGTRKIVIATNIAETSITIDDIVYVVDCGFMKVKDFNPETGLLSLDSYPVSRANALQRKGRAGRVQAGHCFHLFTSLQYEEMQQYLAPEILRTRLEELCLMIKILKLGKIEPFVSRALDVPSKESVKAAIVTLQNLQALDDNEELLPLGYHLARLPLDPHTGKMILFGAMFGCLDPICLIAACLSFKMPFVTPLGKEADADRCKKALAEDSRSDHIMLIKAYKKWEEACCHGNGRKFCYDNFLTENTLRMLKKMKKQFSELLYNIGFVSSCDPRNTFSNVHSDNENLITAVICAGLYPNIAKVRKPGKPGKFQVSVLLQNGTRGKLHKASVNAYEKFFPSNWLIYHKIMKTTDIHVYDCSMVSPYPLLFFGGKIAYSITNAKGKDVGCVTVDGWIPFWTEKATYDLVKDLRKQLDKILEDRITSPKVIDLTVKSKEQVIINAIVDLISKEEVNYHDFREEDNYE
uniref:RNA helicase n=1 Tax=Crassostrea virginica TaxID=6565 RepID=A0A8B8EJQ5_CRAVI|nr:ATP-dependent RNA helicase DHX36-like [Crassostrea virginica]